MSKSTWPKWLRDDDSIVACTEKIKVMNENFDEIKQSISQRLYTLHDDAVVITGHGASTTIGTEKQSNSFVRV